MSIYIKNLTKFLSNRLILDNINIEINSGELIALLGPSGSGKTTLLRIISGLENADGGTILFEGQDSLNKKPKDRNVGFVFQHYALFKHMTVFKNIAFGLEVRPRKTRPPKEEIKRKVLELLKLVRLEEFVHRYPAQLFRRSKTKSCFGKSISSGAKNFTT